MPILNEGAVKYRVKGAGVGVFLIEEHARYQEIFTDIKNIVPSQCYRIFKSREYIRLHCAHEL